MAVISDVLRGPYGDIQPDVIITMRAKETSARVLTMNHSSTTTDVNGKYSMTVFPGEYEVMVSTLGHVGDIRVFSDSVNGTLNDFLITPSPEEVTPEVVRTVETFRSEAAASAAAAKADAATASAAVTDTLNKVTTTAQTVTSSVTIKGGLISYGDNIMQANASAANVLLRFRNSSGIEQGALYSQTDNGAINIRWAGTTYTMQGRADGFVSVPKGHTIATALSTPAAVVDAVTTIANSPVSFRGADAANFDVPNNYSIGTWYGFSVVPTTTVVSNGVEQGKPVFYVNARTGNTYALNGLYVGSNPVLTNSGTGAAMIAPPLIPSVGTGERYCKIAEQAMASSAPRGMYFTIAGGRNYGKTGMTLLDVFFSARDSTTTELTSSGLQVLRHGMPLDAANDIRVGAIYNATSGMWELWLAGNGYNAPRVSLVGNYNTDTFSGVTKPENLVWQTTKPSGFIAAAEKRAWTDFNATVDGNGFLKAASPVVKLFGDGTSVLNDASQGVTTERIDTGVYLVSGVLGFNGDGAWGGAGDGIEIPLDENKRGLIWVVPKVLPDGDIEIRTYHRTYDTGPYSTRNIEVMDSGEVYKKNPIYVMMPDGTPIDIPAGRWIDLRVEMPAGDEPETVFEPEPQPEVDLTPEPEVVSEPDGAQHPELETEQPAATESENSVESERVDAPEAETKE